MYTNIEQTQTNPKTTQVADAIKKAQSYPPKTRPLGRSNAKLRARKFAQWR